MRDFTHNLTRDLTRTLAASASLLVLAGCGGGGGGSMTAAATGGTTTPPVTATVVGAPNAPSIGTTGFPQATGATPSFATAPTSPISFGLIETAMTGNSNTGLIALNAPNSTLTWTGNTTVNGNTEPFFTLTIPAFNSSVNLTANTGTYVTDNQGNLVLLAAGALNYTLLTIWNVQASGSTHDIDVGVGGFQTPAVAVPTSGSATYNGTNGVAGAVYVPTGTGTAVSGASITGNATLNVNFGTGSVGGQLSNTTATATDGSGSQSWNTVNLAGNVSSNTFSGTTTTPGATGTFGLASTATGTFKGSFFGPAANEVGATWTLYDSTGGGKAALGTLGAAR